MIASLLGWLENAPILVLGVLLFAGMVAAGATGHVLRLRANRKRSPSSDQAEGQEGYIVSAVLGLLALLMGFTFSMAVDRFDGRRVLVLREANAIAVTYHRAQLLGEPHRARLSGLLIAYTDNRIALATAPREERPKLLAANDELLVDIWAATAAGFDSISNLDFSSALVEAASGVIEADAARKAARRAHVPTEVLAVLLVFLFATAGVLGYVLSGFRNHLAGGFLLLLLTLSLLLIIDIDRPTEGGIRESQAPMERLRDAFKNQTPEAFDRWRGANRAQ